MLDSELITGIKKGDQKAYNTLYKEYYVALCFYARRFTGDKETAEEVVQATIFKLWEKREEIEIQSSLKAYLFRMVQNNSLNHLKQLQIVNQFAKEYTEKLKFAQDYYIITQEDGQSLYIVHELEKEVNEAINQLPEQCRDIFVMSRFQGLKNQEIADKKGVTINTVQKQISIALQKLRELLKHHLPFFIWELIIVLKIW